VVKAVGHTSGPVDAADSFWRDAFALRGAVTHVVFDEVLIFTGIAVLACVLEWYLKRTLHHGVAFSAYEQAGAALGLLLVLRTNSSYDRWWEARKLWGGVTNACRAVGVSALAYGPDDAEWRQKTLRWTAAFPHALRHSLRSERTMPEVVALLGQDEAVRLAAARHMPTAVAAHIAALLRQAREAHGMDQFAFLEAERQRNLLIDHAGGCERILKTPLPRAYSINIRRFIFLFLTTMPFALLPKIGWLTPLATLLVAYPILSLDQIGVELQNPFSVRNLAHLPLLDICNTIEGDLLALAAARPDTAAPDLSSLFPEAEAVR